MIGFLTAIFILVVSSAVLVHDVSASAGDTGETEFFKKATLNEKLTS